MHFVLLADFIKDFKREPEPHEIIKTKFRGKVYEGVRVQSGRQGWFEIEQSDATDVTQTDLLDDGDAVCREDQIERVSGAAKAKALDMYGNDYKKALEGVVTLPTGHGGLITHGGGTGSVAIEDIGGVAADETAVRIEEINDEEPQTKSDDEAVQVSDDGSGDAGDDDAWKSFWESRCDEKGSKPKAKAKAATVPSCSSRGGKRPGTAGAGPVPKHTKVGKEPVPAKTVPATSDGPKQARGGKSLQSGKRSCKEPAANSEGGGSKKKGRKSADQLADEDDAFYRQHDERTEELSQFRVPGESDVDEAYTENLHEKLSDIQEILKEVRSKIHAVTKRTGDNKEFVARLESVNTKATQVFTVARLLHSTAPDADDLEAAMCALNTHEFSKTCWMKLNRCRVMTFMQYQKYEDIKDTISGGHSWMALKSALMTDEEIIVFFSSVLEQVVQKLTKAIPAKNVTLGTAVQLRSCMTTMKGMTALGESVRHQIDIVCKVLNPASSEYLPQEVLKACQEFEGSTSEAICRETQSEDHCQLRLVTGIASLPQGKLLKLLAEGIAQKRRGRSAGLGTEIEESSTAIDGLETKIESIKSIDSTLTRMLASKAAIIVELLAKTKGKPENAHVHKLMSRVLKMFDTVVCVNATCEMPVWLEKAAATPTVLPKLPLWPINELKGCTAVKHGALCIIVDIHDLIGKVLDSKPATCDAEKAAVMMENWRTISKILTERFAALMPAQTPVIYKAFKGEEDTKDMEEIKHIVEEAMTGFESAVLCQFRRCIEAAAEACEADFKKQVLTRLTDLGMTLEGHATIDDINKMTDQLALLSGGKYPDDDPRANPAFQFDLMTFKLGFALFTLETRVCQLVESAKSLSDVKGIAPDTFLNQIGVMDECLDQLEYYQEDNKECYEKAIERLFEGKLTSGAIAKKQEQMYQLRSTMQSDQCERIRCSTLSAIGKLEVANALIPAYKADTEEEWCKLMRTKMPTKQVQDCELAKDKASKACSLLNVQVEHAIPDEWDRLGSATKVALTNTGTCSIVTIISSKSIVDQAADGNEKGMGLAVSLQGTLNTILSKGLPVDDALMMRALAVTKAYGLTVDIKAKQEEQKEKTEALCDEVKKTEAKLTKQKQTNT